MCWISKIIVPMSIYTGWTPQDSSPLIFHCHFVSFAKRQKAWSFCCPFLSLRSSSEQGLVRQSHLKGLPGLICGWFWCAPSATQNFWVCKCSSSSLCSSSILASLFISKEALQLDEEQSQPRAREEQWPKNRLQLVSQNLPWGCY